MEGYRTYEEFLEELTEWGDTAIQEHPEKWNTQERFGLIWARARQGAERGVFSPFLYLALSAGLYQEEAVFLAAALYLGLTGTEGSPKPLTCALWAKFLGKSETTFPEARIFYQAPPVLFERGMCAGKGGIEMRIVPKIFLFLSRGILAEQNIPGMYWYYRTEDPLPFLGKNIRLYEQMQSCIKCIEGKKLIYLHGRKGSGRKLNYAYLAASMGKSLAVAGYEFLSSPGYLQELAAECVLHHGILAVEIPDGADLSLFSDWMGDDPLLVLGESEILPFECVGSRQYLSFEIDAQRVLNDRELFRRITAEYHWDRPQTREDFLNRYAFLPGKMRQILELAKSYALSRGKEGITEQDLRQAVLHSGGHSLQKYAKKVEAVYTMEDLILPARQKEKILHICSRIKNKKHVYEDWGLSEKSPYGNGVSMIFAGPPGTGKTMAAQVVAAQLGMELYRVQLPAVVDKYIGETEKKLNRIFEEAEKSMAILFFDEADVLFSKRTEIKESNDKYNNMEIAFLLQKMEEHEGVSILATNYLQNFDEAFRRRVGDIVDFPIPDMPSREMMWRNMIPARLPVSEDIDYPFLARQFQLTGSMIKNALVYSCFLAAESQEQRLTMEMILRGIAHELEKSGKKLSREDYGEYNDLGSIS